MCTKKGIEKARAHCIVQKRSIFYTLIQRRKKKRSKKDKATKIKRKQITKLLLDKIGEIKLRIEAAYLRDEREKERERSKYYEGENEGTRKGSMELNVSSSLR